MIEILLRYHPKYSMFTFASLLDKTEKFRLHVFMNDNDYDQDVADWLIQSFDNVQVYQAPYDTHVAAKQILQFKRHWMGKGKINKIIQSYTRAPIFTKELIGNQLPPNSWFKKLVATTSRNTFHNHGIFKTYYSILGQQGGYKVDTSFLIWNWNELENMTESELFMKDGTPPIQKYKWEHDLDAYINHARDEQIITYFKTIETSKMPIYMHGKVDPLIELDALGAMDCINYNIMLRKAYNLDVPSYLLERDYYECRTGLQLSIPWDLYTPLMENIPARFKDGRLNEKILIKSNKQKAAAGKLITAGFSLGKV